MVYCCIWSKTAIYGKVNKPHCNGSLYLSKSIWVSKFNLVHALFDFIIRILKIFDLDLKRL